MERRNEMHWSQKQRALICGSLCGKNWTTRLSTSKKHRTEKEGQQMSLFEQFITEDNERVDEPAKERCWIEAGKRSSVRSLAVFSRFSLFGGRMERLRRTQAQVKREVGLREQEYGGKEASDGVGVLKTTKYRCMRCGRSRART